MSFSELSLESILRCLRSEVQGRQGVEYVVVVSMRAKWRMGWSYGGSLLWQSLWVMRNEKVHGSSNTWGSSGCCKSVVLHHLRPSGICQVCSEG